MARRRKMQVMLEADVVEKLMAMSAERSQESQMTIPATRIAAELLTKPLVGREWHDGRKSPDRSPAASSS